MYISAQDKKGDDIYGKMKNFCSISGTPRLIPRYGLGYHQGCYGYEGRADNYSTYQEGVKNGYFVADERYEADNPEGKIYS